MSAPDQVPDRGRIICIGTHHKTGTVWMRRVWHAISKAQGIPLLHVNKAMTAEEIPASGPLICVNWSSEFPKALWDNPEARFLHIIRDPRDVLLSGMRYHLTAPLHQEKFLRVPREDLGGRSYQQHLNALPDDTSRLLFEMLNKHETTLREMASWPYGHEKAVDLRYEDLIGDAECALFRRALERSAPIGLDLDGACQCYWDNSLFGGLAQKDARAQPVAQHVKSGAPEQWKRQMPRAIAELYARRYGKALRMLGYAEDRAWVEACPWMTVSAQGAQAAE